MILARETYKKFGYWPKDLRESSHKIIIVRCPGCRRSRERSMYNHNTRGILCLSCKSRSKAKNLSGKKFGSLNVTNHFEYRFDQENGNSRYWRVICDCGTVKVMRARSLLKKEASSCGPKCKFNPIYKGCESLSGGYWSSVRGRAKDGKMKFTIKLKPTYEILRKQNFQCALSGISIELFKQANKQTMQTASLDRIDSSKGYVPENVQWVHKIVNIMKQNLSDKEFIEWCKIISKNNRSNNV